LTPDEENDQDFEKIIANPGTASAFILEIIRRMRSAFDAERLKGQLDRRLAEDQPFNPGLWILRGLIELVCRKWDIQLATNAFESGCRYASTEYKIDLAKYIDDIALICAKLLADYKNDRRILLALAQLINYMIQHSYDKRATARRFVSVLPLLLKVVPLKYLGGNLISTIQEKIVQIRRNIWPLLMKPC